MQYDNFSPFLHIACIDEASFFNLDGFKWRIVGKNSVDSDTEGFFPVSKNDITFADGGTGLDDVVRKWSGGEFAVTLFQVNAAALFHSFVRLWGHARIDFHGVHNHTFRLVLKGMDEAVPGSQ